MSINRSMLFVAVPVFSLILFFSLLLRYEILDVITFGVRLPASGQEIFRSNSSVSEFRRVSYKISSAELIDIKSRLKEAKYSEFEILKGGYANDDFWTEEGQGVWISTKRIAGSTVRVFFDEKSDVIHFTKFSN